MRKDQFILCVNAMGLFFCGYNKVTAQEIEKPNIILILADDLGYADLSCYGAKEIDTPNIDRLANEGMRFTSFYATAGVSTPTRASIMTGCYPKRVDLHEGVIPPDGEYGLHPEEITIAELLKEEGYTTGCIGKWHLGLLPEIGPNAQGFDYYYGMPGPNHGRSDLYADTMLLKKNNEINYDSITADYTQKAISFIRKHKEKPFFLYMAHSAVHIPLFASANFNRHKGKNALYNNMVEELDWSCGEIYHELENANLLENTILIFTSDNGPYGVAAPPLHGAKGSTWEGGFRVPCIIRWPDIVPAGSICNELATAMDFLPTLVPLVGGKVPNDRKIDGQNIYPLLTNKDAKTPYSFFCYYNREGNLSAIRSGRWKLHLLEPSERWAGKVPVKEALLDTKPTSPLPWLYDLMTDPGETNNVISSHKDVSQKLQNMAFDFDSSLNKERRVHYQQNPQIQKVVP
jgi:arylsulfatase A-like enzyme